MKDLRRYTQLPQLLHMLKTRTITLLSPSTWDDRNDAYFLEKYRERRCITSVLVLCLTESAATYHHWHVFAGNPSGVRIEFFRSAFQGWADKIKGARLEPVNYLKLDQAGQDEIPLEKLPFTKRFAYRDEGEVRLIVEEPDELLSTKSFPFKYSMIKEVVLSPWLPSALFDSVESTIRLIAHKAKFKIRQTTLLDNSEFKKMGNKE